MKNVYLNYYYPGFIMGSFILDEWYQIQKISITDDDYEAKMIQSEKMWKSLACKVINESYYWTIGFESNYGCFALCFVSSHGPYVLKTTKFYNEAKKWLQEVNLEDIIKSLIEIKKQIENTF